MAFLVDNIHPNLVGTSRFHFHINMDRGPRSAFRVNSENLQVFMAVRGALLIFELVYHDPV